MILQRLIEYADREGLGQDKDFGTKHVRWLIELDGKGRLAGLTPLGVKEGKHRGEDLVGVPETPQNEMQSPKVANFLVDSAARVLDWPSPDADDRERKKIGDKHLYFWTLIREFSGWSRKHAKDDRAAGALLASRKDLKLIRSRLEKEKGRPTDNVAFSVAGRPCHELQLTRRFWSDRRKGLADHSAAEGALAGLDLATGTLENHIALTHNKIRGVLGANSMGAPLVSNDKAAFQSYGLDAGLNAPVGISAEAKYRAALNTLVANGKPLGEETTVAIWTKKKIPLDFWALIEADEGAVRQAFDAPITGRPDVLRLAEGKPNDFYALGLSGVGGRLMIRSWMESTVEDVLRNVRSWFDHLAIVSQYGDRADRHFKLWALLFAIVREKADELPPPLPLQLLMCALQGSAPPRVALELAVRRNARAAAGMPSLSDEDQARESSKLTARTALMKLCLIRSQQDTEVNASMKTQLDSEQNDPAYLCGRLLAVMDRLQYLALGKVGAGVVERTYGAASATPGVVFGRLFRGAQTHISKLEGKSGGAAENVRKDFEEICGHLQAWPKVLTLEGQARFALGFYHQKADYRRRSQESKAEPDAR